MILSVFLERCGVLLLPPTRSTQTSASAPADRALLGSALFLRAPAHYKPRRLGTYSRVRSDHARIVCFQVMLCVFSCASVCALPGVLSSEAPSEGQRHFITLYLTRDHACRVSRSEAHCGLYTHAHARSRGIFLPRTRRFRYFKLDSCKNPKNGVLSGANF